MNHHPVIQGSTLNTDREPSYLLWLVLAGGGSLLPLLPCGIWFGFGLLFQALFFAHLAVFIVATLTSLWYLRRAFFDSVWMLRAVSLVLVVSLISVFLAGSLPITAADALVHHLAVPRWWLESGKISQIPWHEWSYYPMLVNLGYAGLLSVGSSRLVSFYHCLFGIQVVGVTLWCARQLSLPRGILFIVVVASVTLPLWLRLESVALVDLGLALFALLAAAFLLALDSSQEGKCPGTMLCYASGCGIALGLAAGCKLNGALFAVVLIGSTACSGVWSRYSRGVLFITLFSAFVTYLPWLVKSYVWTGNPLYPQFKSLLGGAVPSYSYLAPWVHPLQHRHLLYGESWLEIVLLPIRIFIEGQDGDPRHFDGQLSSLLLLGFGACLTGRDRLRKVLFGWTPLLFVVLALTFSSARARYLAPIIPLLTLGIGVTLQQVYLFLSPIQRRLGASALVLYSVAISVLYVGRELLPPFARQYLQGVQDESSYMRIQVPEYALIEHVNKSLPKSSVVYLIGTKNNFYLFDTKVRSAGYYSTLEVIDWIKRAKDSDAIQQAFHSVGVTHLLVNDERFAKSLYELLTLEERHRWNDFSTRHLVGQVASNGYSLWAMVPE